MVLLAVFSLLEQIVFGKAGEFQGQLLIFPIGHRFYLVCNLWVGDADRFHLVQFGQPEKPHTARHDLETSQQGSAHDGRSQKAKDTF